MLPGTRKLLKGQKDPDYHWKYYIDQHRPDAYKASKVRYDPVIKEINELNTHLPLDQRSDARLVGEKLLVNGQLYMDPVSPPSFKELYEIPHHLELAIKSLTVAYSTPTNVDKNTFRGYALEISSFDEVKVAYQKLKIEEKYATHIMMACSFEQNSKELFWSCDDGEDNGGHEILKVIREMKMKNIAAFVARWKVGANMGPKRFKCISQNARAVIQKIKVKNEIRNSVPEITE